MEHTRHEADLADRLLGNPEDVLLSHGSSFVGSLAGHRYDESSSFSELVSDKYLTLDPAKYDPSSLLFGNGVLGLLGHRPTTHWDILGGLGGEGLFSLMSEFDWLVLEEELEAEEMDAAYGGARLHKRVAPRVRASQSPSRQRPSTAVRAGQRRPAGRSAMLRAMMERARGSQSPLRASLERSSLPMLSFDSLPDDVSGSNEPLRELGDELAIIDGMVVDGARTPALMGALRAAHRAFERDGAGLVPRFDASLPIVQLTKTTPGASRDTIELISDRRHARSLGSSSFEVASPATLEQLVARHREETRRRLSSGTSDARFDGTMSTVSLGDDGATATEARAMSRVPAAASAPMGHRSLVETLTERALYMGLPRPELFAEGLVQAARSIHPSALSAAETFVPSLFDVDVVVGGRDSLADEVVYVTIGDEQHPMTIEGLEQQPLTSFPKTMPKSIGRAIAAPAMSIPTAASVVSARSRQQAGIEPGTSPAPDVTLSIRPKSGSPVSVPVSVRIPAETLEAALRTPSAVKTETLAALRGMTIATSSSVEPRSGRAANAIEQARAVAGPARAPGVAGVESGLARSVTDSLQAVAPGSLGYARTEGGAAKVAAVPYLVARAHQLSSRVDAMLGNDAMAAWAGQNYPASFSALADAADPVLLEMIAEDPELAETFTAHGGHSMGRAAREAVEAHGAMRRHVAVVKPSASIASREGAVTSSRNIAKLGDLASKLVSTSAPLVSSIEASAPEVRDFEHHADIRTRASGTEFTAPLLYRLERRMDQLLGSMEPATIEAAELAFSAVGKGGASIETSPMSLASGARADGGMAEASPSVASSYYFSDWLGDDRIFLSIIDEQGADDVTPVAGRRLEGGRGRSGATVARTESGPTSLVDRVDGSLATAAPVAKLPSLSRAMTTVPRMAQPTGHTIRPMVTKSTRQIVTPSQPMTAARVHPRASTMPLATSHFPLTALKASVAASTSRFEEPATAAEKALARYFGAYAPDRGNGRSVPPVVALSPETGLVQLQGSTDGSMSLLGDAISMGSTLGLTRGAGLESAQGAEMLSHLAYSESLMELLSLEQEMAPMAPALGLPDRVGTRGGAVLDEGAPVASSQRSVATEPGVAPFVARLASAAGLDETSTAEMRHAMGRTGASLLSQIGAAGGDELSTDVADSIGTAIRRQRSAAPGSEGGVGLARRVTTMLSFIDDLTFLRLTDGQKKAIAYELATAGDVGPRVGSVDTTSWGQDTPAGRAGGAARRFTFDPRSLDVASALKLAPSQTLVTLLAAREAQEQGDGGRLSVLARRGAMGGASLRAMASIYRTMGTSRGELVAPEDEGGAVRSTGIGQSLHASITAMVRGVLGRAQQAGGMVSSGPEAPEASPTREPLPVVNPAGGSGASASAGHETQSGRVSTSLFGGAKGSSSFGSGTSSLGGSAGRGFTSSGGGPSGGLGGGGLPLVTPAVHAVQRAAHMSDKDKGGRTTTTDEVAPNAQAKKDAGGEQDKEALLTKLVPDIYARIQRKLQRENDRFGSRLV